MNEPTEISRCRVPLLAEADAFVRIRQVYRHELAVSGRVRNLTKVTANSPAVWQATTRALHLYDTLRKIDRPLVDLLCLYTSLLNGCHYCVDDAAGEALNNGWSEHDLLALGPGMAAHFSPATTAALRYAKELTRSPESIGDDVARDLASHFGDEAILEISCVVGMKNFWNRFATGLRIPAEGKCADPALMQKLMDMSRSFKESEGGHD